MSCDTAEAKAGMKGITFPAWHGKHYVTVAELLVRLGSFGPELTWRVEFDEIIDPRCAQRTSPPLPGFHRPLSGLRSGWSHRGTAATVAVPQKTYARLPKRVAMAREFLSRLMVARFRCGGDRSSCRILWVGRLGCRGAGGWPLPTARRGWTGCHSVLQRPSAAARLLVRLVGSCGCRARCGAAEVMNASPDHP